MKQVSSNFIKKYLKYVLFEMAKINTRRQGFGITKGSEGCRVSYLPGSQRQGGPHHRRGRAGGW